RTVHVARRDRRRPGTLAPWPGACEPSGTRRSAGNGVLPIPVALCRKGPRSAAGHDVRVAMEHVVRVVAPLDLLQPREVASVRCLDARRLGRRHEVGINPRGGVGSAGGEYLARPCDALLVLCRRLPAAMN